MVEGPEMAQMLTLANAGPCPLWVIRYRGFPAPSHYDVCYAPNIDQTFAAPRLVAMGHNRSDTNRKTASRGGLSEIPSGVWIRRLQVQRRSCASCARREDQSFLDRRRKAGASLEEALR
jgi:hypothetical protein